MPCVLCTISGNLRTWPLLCRFMADNCRWCPFFSTSHQLKSSFGNDSSSQHHEDNWHQSLTMADWKDDRKSFWGIRGQVLSLHNQSLSQNTASTHPSKKFFSFNSNCSITNVQSKQNGTSDDYTSIFTTVNVQLLHSDVMVASAIGWNLFPMRENIFTTKQCPDNVFCHPEQTVRMPWVCNRMRYVHDANLASTKRKLCVL
jgi:hypothetical protein